MHIEGLNDINPIADKDTPNQPNKYLHNNIFITQRKLFNLCFQ